MATVQALLSDVLDGHRLTEAEAKRLLSVRGRDVWRVTAAADEMRERRTGDTVTYVRNQNLHVTARTSAGSAALAGRQRTMAPSATTGQGSRSRPGSRTGGT